MDSLHLNIFHLYDVGFRSDLDHVNKAQCYDDDDDIDFECIDNTLSNLRNTLRKKRSKYQRAFRRYSNGNNNKFNIGQGFNLEILNATIEEKNQENPIWSSASEILSKWYGQKTWTDNLIQYLTNNETPKEITAKILRIIKDEHYDTDSILADFVLGRDGKSSNIQQILQNASAFELICNFVLHSQRMISLISATTAN